MKDIAVVMVTADRSPQKNYLMETLANLDRSGVFHSEHLYSFSLFDSIGKCANANVSDALAAGVRGYAPWILFLEDDIDVCDDFLGSVRRWLARYSRHDRKVYFFGANYPNALRAEPAWDYKVSLVYGTQAFAIRPIDAASLSSYLCEHEFRLNKSGTAYDILMHHWAKENGIEYFLASAPSFVQHIGMESLINPRANVHTFPSWPGREWSFR